MIPRVTSRAKYITNILFFGLAVYAAVYGVTYAYALHQITNGVCAWLVAVHFGNSEVSWRGLREVLEGGGVAVGDGDEDDGRRKKRP